MKSIVIVAIALLALAGTANAFEARLIGMGGMTVIVEGERSAVNLLDYSRVPQGLVDADSAISPQLLESPHNISALAAALPLVEPESRTRLDYITGVRRDTPADRSAEDSERRDIGEFDARLQVYDGCTSVYGLLLGSGQRTNPGYSQHSIGAVWGRRIGTDWGVGVAVRRDEDDNLVENSEIRISGSWKPLERLHVGAQLMLYGGDYTTPYEDERIEMETGGGGLGLTAVYLHEEGWQAAFNLAANGGTEERDDGSVETETDRGDGFVALRGAYWGQEFRGPLRAGIELAVKSQRIEPEDDFDWTLTESQLRLGAAYYLPDRLLVGLELHLGGIESKAENPNGPDAIQRLEGASIHLGAEWLPRAGLALRAGLAISGLEIEAEDDRTEDLGNVGHAALTLGAGLKNADETLRGDLAFVLSRGEYEKTDAAFMPDRDYKEQILVLNFTAKF